MKPHLERRLPDRDPADTLSPECLALLVSCGDEIRATDQIERPPLINPVRRGRRRDDLEDLAIAAAARSTPRPVGAGDSESPG